MIVIGLTGGIGMGKSTVASLFARHHIPVHDADAQVHEFFNPAHPLYFDITTLFPVYRYPKLYDDKTKLLQRSKLGEIVFEKEPEKRAELEALLHPAVRESQDDFVRAKNALGCKAVILEIPLLFETGAEERCDITITVSCSAMIQQQRVMERPGMTLKKFTAIRESQMNDGDKQKRADYTMFTDRGMAETQAQIRAVLKDLDLKKDTPQNNVRAYPYKG